MPTYLEIAVNVPQVSGEFDYHLPAELEGLVASGCLVTVPFGRQTVQGLVLGEVERPRVPQTRPVSALLDPQPALNAAQIALARGMASESLAPLAACVGLMLPPGLGRQADTLYTATQESLRVAAITELQRRLLKLLLERGPLRGRQIDRAVPRTNWRLSMPGLVRRKLVDAQPVLPEPGVRPKQVQTARLKTPPENGEDQLTRLGRGEVVRRRRAKILDFLSREAGPVDVAWIYAQSGGNLADLKFLAGLGLIELGRKEVVRDPLGAIDPVLAAPPTLTPDQAQVWTVIEAMLAAARRGEGTQPLLIHGVTGSGKTELYLRAVDAVLQAGLQAIVMVPEIALTPQTVRRFLSRFPGRVGLIHSGLSEGERYDTWRRARAAELDVVVGPRSALFNPLPRIGLIVIDEAHDHSYYQSEAPPYYHARETAVAYAAQLGAVCLLGSASPAVESLYRAEQGEWGLEELRQRIRPGSRTATSSEDLPPVRVVDMRLELKTGNRSIFSRPLQEGLAAVLERGEQAILFLNRRGTATYVFCRTCGQPLRCPRCAEAPLTYHSEGAALRCHHCGYTRNLPKKCPNCASPHIRHYGAGTERVEQEIQSLLPQARSLRWDWDTTRKKGAHDLILGQFVDHQADILIGTQMLAKGLDLPRVTLVGIILAEVGLNLPDFRAPERTFQTLLQVAGRSGRSELGGETILQTFDPDNYVIRAAAGHDFQAFYQQELALRRPLGYPPFGRLVRLESRDSDPARLEKRSVLLADRLKELLNAQGRRQTELIGPTPCFYARVSGEYRWQIVLRGPDPAAALIGFDLAGWRVEVNPQSLL